MPELEDLASRNGTHVHGERLAKGARHPLSIGTVFQLGSATIVVQRGGASLGRGSVKAPAPDPAAKRVVIEDPTMQQLYGLIDVVAPSELCVPILGETGVGKEIYAETIHQRSACSAGRFLRLNCAACASASMICWRSNDSTLPRRSPDGAG